MNLEKNSSSSTERDSYDSPVEKSPFCPIHSGFCLTQAVMDLALKLNITGKPSGAAAGVLTFISDIHFVSLERGVVRSLLRSIEKSSHCFVVVRREVV
jgi:hypothetical protein